MSAIYPLQRLLENIPKNIPKLPWISIFRKPQVSFRVPKLTHLTKLPFQLLMISMIFSTVLLMAGIIYNFTPDSEGNYPKPMGFNQMGQPILVHPELNDQFLIESLVAAIFFTLGALGILLVRYSAAIKGDTRSATSVLVVGLLLFLVTILASTFMLGDKGIKIFFSF